MEQAALFSGGMPLMWPWEHIAVAYLVYSFFVRVWTGHPPQDRLAVGLLAFGALFPDLVDKPLGWMLGILPSGTSLGHSVLLALPLTAMVVVAAGVLGRPGVGIAFGVGYLLHLPCDALYAAVILGAPVDPGTFAWPLVPATPMEPRGFSANVYHYFGRFVARLTGPNGLRYLVAEGLIVGGALVVWLHDGAPGVQLDVSSSGGEPDPHR